MALSWNEIKDRAVRFSKEWQDTEREEADLRSHDTSYPVLACRSMLASIRFSGLNSLL